MFQNVRFAFKQTERPRVWSMEGGDGVSVLVGSLQPISISVKQWLFSQKVFSVFLFHLFLRRVLKLVSFILKGKTLPSPEISKEN